MHEDFNFIGCFYGRGMRILIFASDFLDEGADTDPEFKSLRQKLPFILKVISQIVLIG